MNEHDPCLLCFLGILIAHFLTVHDDRPLVFRVNAGQNLHQGRFPGAVLSHERMDFSMPQDKSGVFKHLIRSEGFVYPLHLNLHFFSSLDLLK